MKSRNREAERQAKEFVAEAVRLNVRAVDMLDLIEEIKSSAHDIIKAWATRMGKQYEKGGTPHETKKRV